MGKLLRRARRGSGGLLAAVLVAGLSPTLVAAGDGLVTEVRYVPTSAQGGAVIRVEIHRDPFFDGDGQPVLLSYSPYNSIGAPTGTGVEGNDNVSAWVEDGIAAASADVLGTRGSTGCWDYGGADEQQSGVDVVNFLSGLTPDVDGEYLGWASGNVGMTGVSYDGTTANMVAAVGDRAPGLKAVVPVAAISRWYGYAFSNGVRFAGNSEVATDEGFDTPLAFDLGFSQTVHEDNAVDGLVAHNDGDCGAVEHTLQAYSRNPDYGDFWVERDYTRATAEQWTAATMIVHGWNDHNVRADEAIRLYEHLATLDDPATPEVEGPDDLRLWMTQDAHADGSGEGYAQALEDFWFAHLLDDAGAAERLDTVHPRVRSAAQVAPGRPPVVTTGDTWPLAGTGRHTLFLNRTYEQDLDPVTVPGPGTGEVGELSYVNRFDEPTDGRPGAYGPSSGWLDSGLATEELSRNDPWSNEGNGGPGTEVGGQGYYSLFFSTGTLDRDTRVSGRAVLEGWFQMGLLVAPSGATITPILVDVAPDGSMTTIQRGFMNVDYRDGLEAPATSNAGIIRVVIPFLPEDHVVPAGHRIGMLLQSSNSVWALPGTPAGFNSVHLGPMEGLTDTGTVLHLPLVDATDPLFSDEPGR